MPSDKLKLREVVMIDIANDPVLPGDYKPDEDPSKFQSQKTGRGPLTGKWQDSVSWFLSIMIKLDFSYLCSILGN